MTTQLTTKSQKRCSRCKAISAELARSQDTTRKALDALMRLIDKQRNWAAQTEETLAAALLLGGLGQNYEPAVMLAIRNYREASSEVRRFSKDRRLTKSVRNEVVAGFARIREQRRLDLGRLGVQIEEVDRGDSVDKSKHEIVGSVAGRSPAHHNRVAECVCPGFRWTPVLGQTRWEPARVIVAEYEPARSNRV